MAIHNPTPLVINPTITTQVPGLFLMGEAEIARGRSNQADYNYKYGRVRSVNTADPPVDIWLGGGLYTGHPTTGFTTINIVSNNANDAALGTGARKIRLFGLDTNYDFATEELYMNGTTPVTGTITWSRVFKVYIVETGSTLHNLGTIKVYFTGQPAVIFGYVEPRYNQSSISACTVNRNAFMLVKHVRLHLISGTSAYIAMCIREHGEAYRPRRFFHLHEEGHVDEFFPLGLTINEKADIKFTLKEVGSNNTDISAEFEYYIVFDTHEKKI